MKTEGERKAAELMRLYNAWIEAPEAIAEIAYRRMNAYAEELDEWFKANVEQEKQLQ